MIPLRSIAKEIIYNSAYLSGLTHIARQQQKSRLIILTYHSFTENKLFRLLHSIPISHFERQLAFLMANYMIVSLSEGIHRLQSMNSNPMAMAAISIDDGFIDNYTLMFNILKKYQIPATIFIATDFIETGRPPWPTQIIEILEQTESQITEYPVRLSLDSLHNKAKAVQILMDLWKHLPGEERFSFIIELRKHLRVQDSSLSKPLTWAQIAEMAEHNIEFGSHTVYHSILPALSEAVAMNELSASKAVMEERLGKPCTLFAYPNGDWDEQSRELAGNAGYSAAVTQQCGMNGKDSDVHALKRIGIPHNETLGTFACRTGLLAIHRTGA